MKPDFIGEANRMIERSKAKVTLKPLHLTSANKTKTKLICHECDKEFYKVLGRATIEVKCPHCGGFDTEPI